MECEVEKMRHWSSSWGNTSRAKELLYINTYVAHNFNHKYVSSAGMYLVGGGYIRYLGVCGSYMIS